jgi:hypothetical protein
MLLRRPPMKVLRFLPIALAVPLLLVGVVAPGFAGPKPGIPVFDPTDFGNPMPNPYFPLVAGTTWVYEARTEDGLETTTVTVSSNTPTIAGVPTIEVHDVVTLDVGSGPALLIEATRDWYAIDDFGNVWYMGEDTVEHLYDENWNETGTTTEGSWIAGTVVNGQPTEPGIIMLADRSPGVTYRQEFAADVAEDMAKIEKLNGTVSVPYGDFSDVLVTKEWTPLEPGGIERKSYVSGIGLVLTEAFHGKGTVREELVSFTGP